MRYRPRRRKPTAVRERRLSYGTSGNGDPFQSHVNRELKAIHQETSALREEIRALREETRALREETRALRREMNTMRREQDKINERLLLLITSVADDVAKFKHRQDRINRMMFNEFKLLRRRVSRLE